MTLQRFHPDLISMGKPQRAAASSVRLGRPCIHGLGASNMTAFDRSEDANRWDCVTIREVLVG